MVYGEVLKAYAMLRAYFLLQVLVDHIVPASLGGESILENLQPLCFRCNTEKRNRDDTDFLKME